MGVHWNGSRSLQPPPLSFTYSFASYSWNDCAPNFVLTDNAHSDVNTIRRSFPHLYNCWLGDCIQSELIMTLASSVSIRDGLQRTGGDGAELVYSRTKRTDKYIILGDLGGSSTTRSGSLSSSRCEPSVSRRTRPISSQDTIYKPPSIRVRRLTGVGLFPGCASCSFTSAFSTMGEDAG